MLLTKILEKLDNREIKIKRFGKISANQIDIESITQFSKEAMSGKIFVCLSGEKHDGHFFISEALKKGVRVFLSERNDLELESGILIISNNARKTMAEIAKIIYEFPFEAVIKIAVTGTKGKSTVCELVASALRSFGIKTLSVGTLGAYLEEKIELSNTTPDATFLFPLMKRAYDLGARVFVIEVSSQALKDLRVWGINFDIVAFTSFGKDHIGAGEHATFSEYLSTKKTLFTSYGARLAVTNYDDPYSSFFTEKIKDVIKCGASRGSDYRIENIRSGFFGMSFSLSGICENFSLTGNFNATNIAISAAILQKITGKPLFLILRALAKIRIKGRMECYCIRSRFTIIDYAHNEKSLNDLLKFVRSISKRKIITVFGSVGERSRNRRRELAEIASGLSDFSVITSDNPNFENPYEIAEEIYSYYPEKEKALIVVDRNAAIRSAFKKSRPGDIIMLLGKGHEEYMLENGKKLKFSERDIIFDIKKDINFEI